MSFAASLFDLLRSPVPEPISDADIDRIEKLGIYIPLLFAAYNSIGLLYPPALIHAGHYRLFLVITLPALLLVSAICAVARRRARTRGQHERALAVSLLLLVWTATTGLIVSGRFGAPTTFYVVLIAFARFALDARFGALAAVASSVCVTTLCIVRITGVLPDLPVYTDSPPLPRAYYFTSLAWHNVTLFVVFILSSAVTNRVRLAAHALAEERVAKRTLLDVVARSGIGRLTGESLSGRYRLRELLGRGGMGEVYDAERIDDGREVAVKILFPHLHDADVVHERFAREAEAVRRLPSTCTPELLDVGAADDGTPYIVMERLHGEDLGGLLRRRGRLTPEEVGSLLERLAAVLELAHAHSVVHRDLKPSNVFLVGEEVRLLDFGVAHLIDDDRPVLTGDAQVIGSPGYLSPEQVRGERDRIGPQTDVFALGAIAYRALTGENAFPARGGPEAVYEALFHRPKPPSAVQSDIPSALDAVIARALAKEPSDRYAGASELAHDFALARRGLSTLASPAPVDTLTMEVARPAPHAAVKSAAGESS